MNLSIPVGFGVRVQSAKDDGQDDVNVLADKVNNVFVLYDGKASVRIAVSKPFTTYIPVIQSPFRDLEVL